MLLNNFGIFSFMHSLLDILLTDSRDFSKFYGHIFSIFIFAFTLKLSRLIIYLLFRKQKIDFKSEALNLNCIRLCFRHRSFLSGIGTSGKEGLIPQTMPQFLNQSLDIRSEVSIREAKDTSE